jgi:hypothetical protein
LREKARKSSFSGFMLCEIISKVFFLLVVRAEPALALCPLSLEKADGKNTRAAPWTCFFYCRRWRSFAFGVPSIAFSLLLFPGFVVDA